MKIVYIIESLSNSGGMERVIAQKANWLADKAYQDVSIVTFAQHSDIDDFFQLSDNVKRVKINLKDFDKKKLSLFLTEWLKDNPQDICISTYGREFSILPQLEDGSKKIVEFHFAYDINKHWLANSCSKLKTSLVGAVKTWLMTRTAKKYDKIVCLTKADYKRWRKHTDKVVQIYNPITISSNKTSDCISKEIVAIGRMDKQKGFDLLIDCWKLLEEHYPDWQLKIYGGGDPTIYNNQISNLGLKHIKILGPTDNVPAALCESSIYVLSSRYEGFSLTICEAMTCGLPIVSFDCPSGPAELISHGLNGFLVKNVGDTDTMARHISSLIENENMRKRYGSESLRMSKEYNIEKILAQWVSLFERLTESKA